MPTPCNGDNRFISPSEKVMREAAALCFDCPMFKACKELGKGEREGVYAGELPSDPGRVAHRRANNRNRNCRNGHPRDKHGTVIGFLVTESSPLLGCAECSRISREGLARVDLAG